MIFEVLHTENYSITMPNKNKIIEHFQNLLFENFRLDFLLLYKGMHLEASSG